MRNFSITVTFKKFFHLLKLLCFFTFEDVVLLFAKIILNFGIILTEFIWLENNDQSVGLFYIFYIQNHYKNILSSMLFPKLPLHKPKLSLAEKSIHNMNDVVLELSSKKEEK